MADAADEGKGRFQSPSVAEIVTLNSFQGRFLLTRLRRLGLDGS
jgi:hypothetical protein